MSTAAGYARRSRLPFRGAALTRTRTGGALLAGAAAIAALELAGDSGVQHVSVGGIADTVSAALRALAAATVLFGVCGYGVTRLLLPDELRRHELLWVLPVGGCTAALALTVLGYAYVPFVPALALVLVGGAALSAVAVRRRGAGPRPGLGVAWPSYVAALLVAVALIPFFVAGFPTVIGTGSDSHLAAGTAEFLRHNHPTSVNPSGPVDRVPLVWRSKPPIYYALGAVATLSGLETWEALAPLAALMLALAALGMFLLARELLGVGLAGGVVALAATALDRMVLHTGMTPYFNQTWGYFTLPFALVLAWWAVSRRSGPAALLLALFLAVGAFAYPLALPIPLLALAGFLAFDLRERRRAGRPSGLPRLYRGRRSLVWLVPLGVLLAVPILGVAEKTRSAARVVLDPSASLKDWGGDVFHFIPGYQFFALPSATLWWLGLAALLALAAWSLRHVARPLAFGLAVVIVLFLAASFDFRHRHYGQYFEFKTLAFVAPLVVACACAGASRLRVAAPLLLAALLASAFVSGRQEVVGTGHQLSRETIGLRAFDRALPPSASIRLDMPPNLQIWAAYMLPGQPLCSQLPLLGTSYPHVQFSRRADYLLLDHRTQLVARGRPTDAVGPPVMQNRGYALYRARPTLPGPDWCSRRMVQTVKHV